MNIAMDSYKIKLISAIQSLNPDLSAPELTILEKQRSHQQCILCGDASLFGLKLNFYSDNQQQVWSLIKTNALQQGYSGILHGGFISALLDGGMCQALFNQDIEAVTADMNVRFKHEVAINSEVLLCAKVNSKTPPLYKVQAELYVGNQLMASATARFFKRKQLEVNCA